MIGIANSVELFKGDLKYASSSQSQSFLPYDLESLNVEKIIFDPYTKSDLETILFLLLKYEYDKP